MTTEQAESQLSKAINERGYIVIACWGAEYLVDHKPGEAIGDVTHQGFPLPYRFFVISETDRADFLEHQRCMGLLEMAKPNRIFRYWRLGID